MEQSGHVVDVSFSIRGGPIPADHGFPLYAAISRLLPDVHADDAIGIHPIVGRLLGDRQLALAERSRLVLRVPAERVGSLLPLAGKTLQIGGQRVVVGVPTVHPLRPAAALASRLVVIKGFLEPEPFLEAARRQLAERGIEGAPALVRRICRASLEGRQGGRDEIVRRTIRIHDKEIVGFALAVVQLRAADSIRLQEVGLGGRRRFGCGLFTPVKV